MPSQTLKSHDSVISIKKLINEINIGALLHFYKQIVICDRKICINLVFSVEVEKIN